MIKIIIMHIKMSSVCRFSMHVNIQRLYVTMCACGHNYNIHVVDEYCSCKCDVHVCCIYIHVHCVSMCGLMCIIADVDHKRLIIIIQTKIIFIGPINSVL